MDSRKTTVTHYDLSGTVPETRQSYARWRTEPLRPEGYSANRCVVNYFEHAVSYPNPRVKEIS
jgi:hypothetical protein